MTAMHTNEDLYPIKAIQDVKAFVPKVHLSFNDVTTHGYL